MDNGTPRSKGESPHLRRRFALGDCRIRRDTHIYSFRIFSVLQAVLTAMINWQSAGQIGIVLRVGDTLACPAPRLTSVRGVGNSIKRTAQTPGVIRQDRVPSQR